MLDVRRWCNFRSHTIQVLRTAPLRTRKRGNWEGSSVISLGIPNDSADLDWREAGTASASIRWARYGARWPLGSFCRGPFLCSSEIIHQRADVATARGLLIVHLEETRICVDVLRPRPLPSSALHWADNPRQSPARFQACLGSKFGSAVRRDAECMSRRLACARCP